MTMVEEMKSMIFNLSFEANTIIFLAFRLPHDLVSKLEA